VSTHKFPKDLDRREKWIRTILRKNWQPAPKAIICSLHFQAFDFITESQDSNKNHALGNCIKKRLKPDAIPSIFPHVPVYFFYKETAWMLNVILIKFKSPK